MGGGLGARKPPSAADSGGLAKQGTARQTGFQMQCK